MAAAEVSRWRSNARQRFARGDPPAGGLDGVDGGAARRSRSARHSRLGKHSAGDNDERDRQLEAGGHRPRGTPQPCLIRRVRVSRVMDESQTLKKSRLRNSPRWPPPRESSNSRSTAATPSHSRSPSRTLVDARATLLTHTLRRSERLADHTHGRTEYASDVFEPDATERFSSRSKERETRSCVVAASPAAAIAPRAPPRRSPPVPGRFVAGAALRGAPRRPRAPRRPQGEPRRVSSSRRTCSSASVASSARTPTPSCPPRRIGEDSGPDRHRDAGGPESRCARRPPR